MQFAFDQTTPFCTNSPVHLLTYLPSHLCTYYLLTCSPVHQVTCSLKHLLTWTLAHLLTYSPVSKCSNCFDPRARNTIRRSMHIAHALHLGIWAIAMFEDALAYNHLPALACIGSGAEEVGPKQGGGRPPRKKKPQGTAEERC